MSNTETFENDTITEAANEFRSGAAKAKQQVADAGAKFKDKAEQKWEDVVQSVQDNPGKALGLTLLAGVVVGAFLAASSRRRSSPTAQFRDIAGNGAEAWGRLKCGLKDASAALKDALDDAVEKFN